MTKTEKLKALREARDGTRSEQVKRAADARRISEARRRQASIDLSNALSDMIRADMPAFCEKYLGVLRK